MRKVSGRLQPDQSERLRANVAAHQASLEAGSIDSYIERDGEFHLLAAEFSGNAEVDRVLRQLRNRIHRVVLRVIQHVPTRMSESINEHCQILALLESGGVARASALMAKHLRGGLKALVPGCRHDHLAF